MKWEKLERLSKPVLRISMGIVFLWFGSQQLTNPERWTGFVPAFASFFGSPYNLVLGNAIFELIFGAFLILGLYTRLSAVLLSLHLFGIAFSIGMTPVGIRDLGLALATLVIFLGGKDQYSLDNKFEK
ncbi:MAG: DoxX family protein [Nanoarchaeota archaeon]|nr:DoxX family protein [Nanoarchaeota archaeon]